MVNEICVKGKRIFTPILSSLHSYGALSRDSFFKIFNVKICSQLLYGVEVWALKRYECLERVQTYACKRYMNVSQNACNAAVLGDCNRFPLNILTAKRAMKYWFKILSMSSDSYVKKMLLNDGE